MSDSADLYRPPGAPVYDEDDRKARRTLLFFAFSLIAVGLGGLVAVSLQDAGSDDPSVAASAGPLPSAGVGPAPGEELRPYIDARTKALGSVKGGRAAVVSFERYLNEGEARAALGKLTVTSLLAAVPGGSPSVVTGGMTEWVDSQIGENRSERDEIRKLIPTVDDPQFKKFYEEEVARLSALVDNVKPDGPLVFGAVVKGSAADLQAAAKVADVRLVDLAPSGELSPDTPFRGIRPEETERANDPPTRPV